MLMTKSATVAPFSRQQIEHSFDKASDGAYVARLASPSGQDTGVGSPAIDLSPGPRLNTAGRAMLNPGVAVRRRSPTLMSGLGSAPQAIVWVRALYDYEADDRTSLSFHEGDLIQVITQLESGWWDGVINGVRGWFPSNYCQVIASPDEILEDKIHTGVEQEEELQDEDDDYEDQYEEVEDGESDNENMTQLSMESTNGNNKSRADFWIPQATPDGRLYYFNTMTGESSMELPLESPSSATETGPRDRMNVNIPEKTRPPLEMMAQGYVRDDDYDSDGNSASEFGDGESIMQASRGSLVSAAM